MSNVTNARRSNKLLAKIRSMTKSLLLVFVLAFLVRIRIRGVEGVLPEVNMGTTILAIKYKDGVVVGADSRTSVSGYVSNRVATKISFVLENDFGIYASPPSNEMQLNSSYFKNKEEDEATDANQNPDIGQLSGNYPSTCCICRSGSAADTQYLADVIRHQLLRRMVLHSTSSCVSEAAHLIKNYLNDDNLSASLICAGYDHLQGEGLIYSIDLGGTMMEQRDFACNGSGSGYILGLIDDCYPKTDGSLWNEDDAVEFVKRAIGLAMERDGSSGGVVRIFIINRNGKKGILHVPHFNLGKTINDLEDTNLSKFAPAKR